MGFQVWFWRARFIEKFGTGRRADEQEWYGNLALAVVVLVVEEKTFWLLTMTIVMGKEHQSRSFIDSVGWQIRYNGSRVFLRLDCHKLILRTHFCFVFALMHVVIVTRLRSVRWTPATDTHRTSGPDRPSPFLSPSQMMPLVLLAIVVDFSRQQRDCPQDCGNHLLLGSLFLLGGG